MKRILLALAVAGFASLSAVALPAMAAETDFAVVDTDADGMVSLEEAMAAGWEWSEEQFGEADADGDGALNSEEFAAAAAG